MSGLFLSFEGGEGAGKSTQMVLLRDWLVEQGRSVVLTLEPGGTPLGQGIRALVLTPGHHVTPRAEALLYAADRAHHVETVVEPALARGDVVVTDRYVDSSLAYQGAGRALSRDDVRSVNAFAVAGRWPDLTVLLDVEPTVGLARARGDGAGDRIEAESLRFHEAVRAAFLELADASRGRTLVVDAGRGIDEVHQAVVAGVRSVVERMEPVR